MLAGMGCLFLKQQSQGVTLAVKVKTRSSRSGPDLKNLQVSELGWCLQSAPVDGQANAELIASVTKFFGVPKSRIELIVGEKSKSKVLMLKGAIMDRLVERIV